MCSTQRQAIVGNDQSSESQRMGEGVEIPLERGYGIIRRSPVVGDLSLPEFLHSNTGGDREIRDVEMVWQEWGWISGG